jgi:multidrug transporter EmrE-like cation transporter
MTLPIVYGTAMAFIDTFTFGVLKAIHLEWISSFYFVIPFLVYACQPYLFLQSLNYEGLAIMNLIWNLLSSLFVTIEGIVLFNETISHTKFIGILLSFFSIYLLS